MTEHGFRFGPGDGYLGVLTRPDGASGDPDVVHIVFNAGLIHRVGPHRVYVRLARALAAKGHWVCRFDLSAHGDSRPQPGGLDPRAQAHADLTAAMDSLVRTCGARRFVLIGICSGAVYSYWTALQDARVAGIFMLDGFWYRTRWTLPIRHWKRFRHQPLGMTLAALARRLVRWRPLRETVSPSPVESLGRAALSNPPRDAFVQGMADLVKRGCAVMVVYSGSVLDYYSYGDQFRDGFGREPWFAGAQYVFRPDLDHTLTSRQSQQGFIDLVVNWAAPAAPTAGRSL